MPPTVIGLTVQKEPVTARPVAKQRSAVVCCLNLTREEVASLEGICSMATVGHE